MVRVVTRRTFRRTSAPTTTGVHVRSEQPSGELLRVVLTLARRALDGNERSDHGLAARVRLTVKASASAAAGPGVRPSATCLCSLRHTGNGGVLHHLQEQSRDRLGPPRSPCKGAAAPWWLNVQSGQRYVRG